MKRALSLLLVLTALFCGAACAQEAADYVGYWVATGFEMEDKSLDPSALGVTAYMELYEDGSCVLAMMDGMRDGTWAVTPTGITTTEADGLVTVYTYTDGALVVEEEGCRLIFTPEAYTLPLNGLTMADFEGDWVFTYVEVGNAVYYAQELGVRMTLSIHDGKGVHAVYDDQTGEVQSLFTGVCEIEEIPDFGTAMLLCYTDEAGTPDGSGIMLLKFDNDELVWYAIDENNNNRFYCFVPEE